MFGDGQRITRTFSELVGGEKSSEGTQKKHHTRTVCISKPSEYSRDSLGGVGNNVSVPGFSWFKSMSQIVGLTATWQDKVEGNPTGAGTASNAKINTNPVHRVQLLFMSFRNFLCRQRRMVNESWKEISNMMVITD